ncbi:MAG: PorP/SprF family type IX secretion system membrane protein [Chitinophagaceae bacterium]
MSNIFTRMIGYALILAWLIPGRGIGQDIHLSQFYETPLLRNPALAGIFTGDIRVEAVYRNQWNSVTIPFQTGALSGEVRFPVGKQNDFLTVALQMTYDQAGTSNLRTTQFLPAINFHKSLSNEKPMYLSIGFMGGFVERQFDPSKMTFDNQYNNGQYDPTAPSGENFSNLNQNYLDGAAGISFSSTFADNVNYFLGGSYYHFNRPNVSYFKDNTIVLQPKWEINAGINISVGEDLKVIGEFNQLKQGTYSEMMIGGLLGFAIQKQGLASNMMIYGGIFLRWNDALVPVIKFDLGTYAFGLSYDANISALKTASQGFGGFELSFSYKGFFTNQNSSLNKVNCPRY